MKTLLALVLVVTLSGCAVGMVNDFQRQAKEDWQVKQTKEVVCNDNLCQTTIFEGYPPKGQGSGFSGNVYDLQVNCANATYRTLNAASISGWVGGKVDTRRVIYSDKEQVLRPGTPAYSMFLEHCGK